MSLSPLAYADSLRIGVVDFVSPDEIKVLLDIDAPDNVALNTGTPRAFPRVNGYVLIPADQGHLVAQVEWITVERSKYPQRKGLQECGLLDLPYPLRKMSLNPLGVLFNEYSKSSEAATYEFRRGVGAYPTVGDPVLLPTQTQLRSIVESGENRHVKIGISPLAASAEVKVDPDRIFGRHLAVLGNTGSGKSCSVAGLIRWSLDAATREAAAQKTGLHPNARFIVLDPNGEYAQAFADIPNVRRFAVDPRDQIEQLRVPLWFWNSEEWCAFTYAAPRAQRPVLIQALRAVRDGSLAAASTPSTDMRRYLRTLVAALHISRAAGDPWRGIGPIRGFRDRLRTWNEGLIDASHFSETERSALGAFRSRCTALLDARQSEWPPAFSRADIDALVDSARAAHSAFGGSDTDVIPIDPDVPRPFTGEQLLRSIEANAEILNATDLVETMLMRIRT